MPTFIIFMKKSVRDTIRGANQMALRSAVNTAVAAVGRNSFAAGGRKLGDESDPASSSAGGRTFNSAAPTNWQERIPSGYLGTVTRFFGLYFTTLLSFDPADAAASSPFRAK